MLLYIPGATASVLPVVEREEKDDSGDGSLEGDGDGGNEDGDARQPQLEDVVDLGRQLPSVHAQLGVQRNTVQRKILDTNTKIFKAEFLLRKSAIKEVGESGLFIPTLRPHIICNWYRAGLPLLFPLFHHFHHSRPPQPGNTESGVKT
jgi:hypothetical protein